MHLRAPARHWPKQKVPREPRFSRLVSLANVRLRFNRVLATIPSMLAPEAGDKSGD